MNGYWKGPWPCEDGSPRRTGAALDSIPLDAGSGGLHLAAARKAPASTMVILRDPGEVYLLGNDVGPDAKTWVERIDPVSLETLDRSPELACGPYWPGGVAAHANGDLYVTCGRYCHRLTADCRLVASRELPCDRPYNSLLVLGDGALVMKDQVRDGSAPSQMTVLEPEGLEPLCPDVECPEPVVARLSAEGNTIYAVGTESVFRYQWNPAGLSMDRDQTWRAPYAAPGHTYGWDPIVAGGRVWFMDNGAHNYSGTMRGAGTAESPVRLFTAEASPDPAIVSVEISGEPCGSITNPPLYDESRRIAVAFDSANGVLAGFRWIDNSLEPQWSTRFSTAWHLLYYPSTGEVIANDHGPAGDDIVAIDIETGREIARVSTASPLQSVVFPAPGWDRDMYYCSFALVARITAGAE